MTKDVSWKSHLPNWLTISRVLVIVPICALLALPPSRASYIIVLLLSVYAMVTDYFDGYLSRKWNVVSDLGRLLDPIADKLLVAALLIMLSAHGMGHPLAVTMIMLREIFISGLREFMQERGRIIHVSTLAKYKTASQMVACFLMLLALAVDPASMMADIARGMLWLSAALTVITGADYCRAAMRHDNNT